MCKALQRRGPDGTGTWVGECAALGHTLLATTPESLVERLPLTHAESACTITADVRLDNREELLAALNLTGETRVIGDGELILLSYLRWGEDCPKHLLGDFAFAIWDERRQQLFCARDHMGMRQLIYHHQPGRHFIFATEVESVQAHLGVPRKINEGRVADFLDGLEAADLTSTLFEEIFRLPPAHWMRASANGITLGRYWQLQPAPLLHLPSDEAYAEAFLGVFTEAVRCRLRSAGPIGSMLSGGMDSGSVAAVAASLLRESGNSPLQCFSAVGPDPGACVETRCIQASAINPDIQATFVDFCQLEGFIDELQRLWAESEPFDWHMTLIRAVYVAGHRAGIKVMLDGVAGDSVTSPGNLIALFVRRGQLRRAAREAIAVARFYGPPLRGWRLLLAANWAAWAPGWLRRLRKRMLQGWSAPRHPLLSSQLARKYDVAKRRRGVDGDFGTVRPYEQAHRRRLAVHHYIVVARERYDRVAAALAIEPRDPFMDIRLISFLLSLPPEQLQKNGWPKLVMRHAMAGRLPTEVIWRRGTRHLGIEFTNALWQHSQTSLAVWPHLLRPFVNARVLATYVKSQFTEMDRERKFKLTVLSSWLARNQPEAESFER